MYTEVDAHLFFFSDSRCGEHRLVPESPSPAYFLMQRFFGMEEGKEGDWKGPQTILTLAS